MGVPSCANDFLINTIARNTWKLDGWVVSDCDAVFDITFPHHGYTNTSDETVATALNAGVDINCGQYYQTYAPQAYANGSINDSMIDRALMRQFMTLVRLGYFDDPATQIYRQYDLSYVNSPYSQKLALTAALESIVLLKNSRAILPLSMQTIKNVAVIGPNADGHAFQGNYHGPVSRNKHISVSAVSITCECC